MKRSKEDILKQILGQKVLPLYFCEDTDKSIEVLKVLYEAGIRSVEYTNRGKGALKNFKEMRKACDKEMKEMILGIGTIKNGQAAKEFISAGAEFMVSPGMVKEVIDIANDHKLLCIPGCMTPTEIITAENLGIRLVKLFPGSLLGPGYVKSIKPLFPEMKFMPTGGVSLNKENIQSWFDAGVSAVGMGSKLISKAALEHKDYQAIRKATEEVVRIVREME